MEVNQNSREHWKKVIEDQAGSGLTVTQYCQQHEIRFHQFHYYKKIFSVSKKKTSSKFTAVQVTAPVEPARIVIYLNKISLTFEGDYDLHQVARLSQLLDQV